MTTRETSAAPGEAEDFIEHLFTASTHDYLMFFTNTGRVYVERVHEVPDMGRAAKGRSIANLLELKADEKIAALIRVVSKTGPNKEDITWTQPNFVFSPPAKARQENRARRFRQRPQRRHHRHRHRAGRHAHRRQADQRTRRSRPDHVAKA
jgi:DNA gyrase/topoisomerase IV subunit A